MIKMVGMVGSLREGSFNKKLALFMQKRYADKLDIEILDIDLPNYNGDLDVDGKRPEKVQAFLDKVVASESVLFVTPEYNHSVSGVLKNAIDWASRGPGLNDKTALLAAGSMGATAGARAHSALRLILDTMAMRALPGNDILLGGFHTKFDENGDINDPGTIEFIDSVVEKFVAFHEVNK